MRELIETGVGATIANYGYCSLDEELKVHKKLTCSVPTSRALAIASNITPDKSTFSHVQNHEAESGV